MSSSSAIPTPQRRRRRVATVIALATLLSATNGDSPVILRPRAANRAPPTDSRSEYYYDPSHLAASSESTLTLPQVLYDAAGHTHTLSDVHAAGREVYLEVRPKAVFGHSTNGRSDHTDGRSDQLIVFGTIATMAIFVGALSARRLRHKRLLEHCMESDLEEEWVVEKKSEKNTDGPRGNIMQRGMILGESTALLGGERYGGDLHWRGDLEKFDV